MIVIVLGAIFMIVGGALVAFPRQLRKIDIGADRGAHAEHSYSSFSRFLGVVFLLLSLLTFFFVACPHGCY
jgi:hypothetical protein